VEVEAVKKITADSCALYCCWIFFWPLKLDSGCGDRGRKEGRREKIGRHCYGIMEF
jgi:hypothetical protein